MSEEWPRWTNNPPETTPEPLPWSSLLHKRYAADAPDTFKEPLKPRKKAAPKAKAASKPAAPVPAGGYEVHEHIFVTGPNAYGMFIKATQKTTSEFSHSHEGGSERHQHPETGPGSYTIDKDEWYAKTGMRGGGRKKFTKKPTGLQLPLAEMEEWQNSFEIVVCDPPEGQTSEGPGIALPMRMVLACRLKIAAIRPGTRPPFPPGQQSD